MKVLSGTVVTKSQFEDSRDLFIMPASAAHRKVGPRQTHEGSSVNSAHTENINQKRWKSIFRRVQRKNMDSLPFQTKPLFGQALTDICEQNAHPPKPIMEVLSVLWRNGPETLGVFRKAGSARCLKEIKEQLNSGVEVCLKDKPVILLADLLKDFLRQLPIGLLVEDQYPSWMAALEKEGLHDRCTELQRVVKNLPEAHFHLLKHLIALLNQISANAETTKMDSNNLALCVSPNLLRNDLNLEMIKNVSSLTQFLIDNCREIFGEDALLGDSDEEEMSDNQDSFHHDSAYDSNDPEAEGSKGSFTDVHGIKSDNEDKTLDDEVSCSYNAVERLPARQFIRRCSEPTIILNKSVQNQMFLTRSQTEMNFYDHHLTKQISDECVCLGTSNQLLPVQRNNCMLAAGQLQLQGISKAISSCSSSSLESATSSTSESSFHTSSPIVSSSSQREALQRKQSFPTRLTPHGNARSENPKKRSQSMKAIHSRTKASTAQGGTCKRAVLPLSGALLQKCLSGKEVFKQVDSRIPSNPPSYEKALEDNGHPMLSQRWSLTVEAARCLSKNTCGHSYPDTESADPCSVKNCSDIHCSRAAENIHISAESANSPESRQTVYEASNTRVTNCCDQQLVETLTVRESYV